MTALGISLTSVADATPPPTQVTACGTTITAPGRYVLANDFLCDSTFGVDIESSNVGFALKGHTINAHDHSAIVIDTANANSPHSRIAVVGPGTVTTGHTSSDSTGVGFGNASKSLVRGIEVTDNFDGLVVKGNGGNNLFIANALVGNFAAGIHVLSSGAGNLFAYNNCGANTYGAFLKPPPTATPSSTTPAAATAPTGS